MGRLFVKISKHKVVSYMGRSLVNLTKHKVVMGRLFRYITNIMQEHETFNMFKLPNKEMGMERVFL